MNTSITIKRSPVVIIRTFAVIELVVFVLYIIATMLDSYKYELYVSLPISNLFTYETLKFPFLSLVQFVVTVYAFFRWYYESYTIHPGSISHRWGVVLRKNKTIPLDESMAVTVSSGPIGKLLHYGTISLKGDAAHKIVLADISRPENLLKTIEQAIGSEIKTINASPDLSKLIQEKEHEKLEFKSSLRFDHREGKVNRNLEKSVMKTVAAFLNSRGGTLVIGLDDNRNPIGLQKDYQTLQRTDKDGFENHFTQVFNSMLGPEFRHLVNLSFHNIADRDICIVQASMSGQPVYLKTDGNEYFYVRTGNITTVLKLSEIEQYARTRWFY